MWSPWRLLPQSGGSGELGQEGTGSLLRVPLPALEDPTAPLALQAPVVIPFSLPPSQHFLLGLTASETGGRGQKRRRVRRITELGLKEGGASPT